jgi:hypothetical protein
MIRRHLLVIVAAGALAVFLWCLWLWQPTRQVRVHTEALLEACEDRDWEDLRELIADDYSDRWGHGKAELAERSRQVFAQFLFLTVEGHDMVIEEADATGDARVRVVLQGRGGPLAEIAIQRVSELKEPFIFRWQQRSWKPWDWQLTRVVQPELRVAEYY